LWQIAQYLGITERQARIAYGTLDERREARDCGGYAF
jgi:hypothetical protein